MIVVIKPIKGIIVIGLAICVFAACKSSKKIASSTKENEQVEETKQFTKADLEINHYFLNATREKLLGNFDEAIKLYRKCLQLDPNNAASAYEIGILAMNGNDANSAENYSRIAYKINPANEWYALLFVEALQRNSKNVEALKVYEKLLVDLPERNEIYFDYSNCYMRLNKTSEAIEVLNKLEKNIGITPDVSIQKEKIYIKQGKIDKAANEINALINANPNEVKYYGILAELYGANNMNDKAFEIYNKALTIDPNNPYINLSLAEYYRQKKEYEKGFVYLKQAFASDDLEIDTKIRILLSYYVLSESENELKKQAFELCDILMVTHPKEAKAFSIAGDFYYRDKKLEKSREAFKQAIQLDKGKYVIWNQLLIIESDLKDFDAMVKDGNEALELFPNEPTLYLLVGIAQLQVKNPLEAIKVLNQGKQLVIDNDALIGQFYANLGDAYYRTKQMSLSDESYEAALKINPNDTYVLNNYAYYLSLRNDKMNRADEMSKKSNELEPNNASYQDTYGWILYGLGKYADAKIWLEKALKNGAENNAVILEHFGDALYKLNDTETAFEYWVKAKAAGSGSDFLERKISEKRLIE